MDTKTAQGEEDADRMERGQEPGSNGRMTRRSAGGLAFIVALPLAAVGVSATPAEDTLKGSSRPYRLASPARGTLVNGGTVIEGAASRKVSKESRLRARFQYAAKRKGGKRRGRRWRRIKGVAPQGSGSSDLAALWDTRELEDGKYVLRSKLNRRHRPTLVTQKRTVRVNGQPEARADAAVAGTGSIRVRFDGSDSIDRGGKVVSWDWAFEDPLAEESGQENVAQGRIVEHAYQEPGNYAVTLTVHDRRGGESTGYYMLRLTQDGQVFNAQLAPETTCECDTMGVKRTGNIEGPREISFDYDGRDKRIERVPDTQRRKVGPYNDGLPVGSKQLDKRKEFFTVVCRFEAIATLTGGSAPAACAEGQRLQAVITYGPVQRVWGTPRASDPRYDSGKDPDDPYDPGDDPKVAEQFGLGGKETGRYAPCLPGSETWCDDDYHGGGAADGTGIIGQSPPNSRKRYQGNRILWLDSPGFPLLEGRAIAAGGANYIANYEAQVGRCKCSWKVEIRINRNFEVTKNEVTEVVCNRPPAAF